MRLASISIVSTVACAILSLALWSTPARSDQLQMVPPPAKSAVSRPARGMTMESVEAKYGAPTRKVAAIGKPPIERWEYPGYTVYFEYRKVIHSVAELAH